MENVIKTKSINMLIACTSSLLIFFANAEEGAVNPLTLEARTLAKAFGGDLKAVLKTSMKSGGPESALQVCNLQAGAIAHKSAISSGWNIGRTALRVRNISNAPDEWELNTLRQFEQRKEAEETLKHMEYSEVVKTGEKSVYRYMKAIPTGEECTTCHGNNIDEKISGKIKLLYLNDQATGFNVGDIRGAFTLEKTLN
ncbi:MAG: hypothetical protein ACI92O_002946 [Colwellia sp.]|jgi:hypothetical protein|tara:strand:+ start:14614 stop:15207 length:594 start_codon:yes stop_codon:yes gene_type:complete